MRKFIPGPLAYITGGQLLLAAAMTLCVIIEPEFAVRIDQGGISNYGTLGSTIIPYSIGFAAAGIFTLLAMDAIEPKTSTERNFKTTGRLLGMLYLLALITTIPYQLTDTLRTVHELATIALFLSGITIAVWLFTHIDRTWDVYLTFSILLLGFATSLATFFGVITLLLAGEMLSLYGFALFYIQASRHIFRRAATGNP